MAPRSLHIDGTRLRDIHGREFTFRGINVAGDAKYPRRPEQPSHVGEGFFDNEHVSFVGRPFNEDEAHKHLGQLKRWGYNGIRYIFTWEALEHAGPGIYDEDFIAHTIKILRIAKEYGFLVFMDPHQDVWSRFSGGSGAPLWTLYAAGFDPKSFRANTASIVHNTSEEPANFPKMIWATNYTRLAAQTMFTLFYAGRDFAPNAILNGRHIQDYLTDHFVNACKHLAQRIHEAGGLEDQCVIGWESMNEPSRGHVGWGDLTKLPDDEVKLKKGPMPSPWQSILLGSGRAVEVENWDMGSMGPYRSGNALIDPDDVSAWINTDEFDRRYGWKRDPNWKLGQCLWAQNGVWEPAKDELLQKDYFSVNPKTGMKLDYQAWSNHYFMQHFRKYRDAIRSVHEDCVILMQSAVLEIPPKIKGTSDDEKRLIFASHYYDGLTLITKHWNKWYNVDVFGVLRHKYSSPAFAVKFGETAIRNCLRDQLSAIRQEGEEQLGVHPTLFTEIGIPFDMDDKYAYKTGDYRSQVAAMDANHFALEGSGTSGYTLWTYVAQNNHEWGDNWNGEDLSIRSIDDKLLPTYQSSFLASANSSTLTINRTDGKSDASSSTSTLAVQPSNLRDHLKSPEIVLKRTATSPDLSNSGLRAAEAFVRPSPVATHGCVVSYGFDLRRCTFAFTLTADTATSEQLPTEIFLPEWHFPPEKTSVEVSGGRWSIDVTDIDGLTMQTMKWWHAAGEQSITVKGLVRKLGTVEENDAEQEVGYYDTLRRFVGL